MNQCERVCLNTSFRSEPIVYQCIKHGFALISIMCHLPKQSVDAWPLFFPLPVWNSLKSAKHCKNFSGRKSRWLTRSNGPAGHGKESSKVLQSMSGINGTKLSLQKCGGQRVVAVFALKERSPPRPSEAYQMERTITRSAWRPEGLSLRYKTHVVPS